MKPERLPQVMARLQEAVQPLPKAALFQLAEEGFDSPFEQLLACMISIRTRDETTVPVARQLFQRARTPKAVAELGRETLEGLIEDSTFHQAKAGQILAIARRCRDKFDDRLPCDGEVMRSFRGVGPKCAHLVLGIACGQPQIGVDIHVHRVTNRWGLVSAPNPEATLKVLERVLPRDYWVEINRLLVPFGKHICTGSRPHCSRCPLLAFCDQLGVNDPR
ncbi:MAG: endonuclease III [Candidatus Competibacteraceae bacterium]|nr:endonuclease III [Candidatus Competibacteraceae bacterium]